MLHFFLIFLIYSKIKAIKMGVYSVFIPITYKIIKYNKKKSLKLKEIIIIT